GLTDSRAVSARFFQISCGEGCARGNFHYAGGVPFVRLPFHRFPTFIHSMSARLDFRSRHLGPVGSDREEMLRATGFATLDALAAAAVPAGIRSPETLDLPEALTEQDALA